MTRTSYRPDIDGLRAVAVLAVVLFHANLPVAAGGFVGVDVFFVISGFLISGIILREQREERFSYLRFYERRIRRILPALLVVLITSAIVAWFVMMPSDLVRFAKWTVAAIFMAPNIAAWEVAGDYFSPSAEETPLLHLWSLGIEEQFYFLFPFTLLLLLRHFNHNTQRAILVSILLASFASVVWMASWQPEAAFYLLPARAWELMLGALIAHHYARHEAKPIPSALATTLGVTGAALIITPVVLPNPGLGSAWIHQALACAGSGLLIALGEHRATPVHRILSLRPIVGVGLISYSLYLWHWPLFSFLAYSMAGLRPAWFDSAILGLIVASFVLAGLTWKFVEQPFRNRKQWSFKPVFGAVVAVQAMLLVSAVIGVRQEGMPQRFDDPRQLRYLAAVDDRNPLKDTCYYDDTTVDLDPRPTECVLGAGAGAPRFLVWGDSHADAIAPAFDLLGDRYGIKGIQATFLGGTTLLNVTRNDQTDSHGESWQEFNRRVLKFLEASPQVTDVFLVGRWPSYVLGRTDYEGRADSRVSYSFGEHDSKEAFRLGLEDTLKALKAANKRVWLVLSVPEADRNVPNWLARWAIQSGKSEIWIESYPDRRALLVPMFGELAAKYDVHLLNPRDVLCRDNGSECRISAEEKALYYDDNHLSATGARYISGALKPAFDAMKET